MPAYDAFIFDIDGTLLDTLPDLTAVTNTVLASYGFPQHPAHEILHFVGRGGRRLIEKAVPAGTSPDVVDEAFKRWQGVHEEIGIRLTKEYVGITEALTALKDQGIKLAALSNKFDGGVQEVVRHFFPGLVEGQHGECDRIPRKPDPTGLLLTMEELGVTPEHTVYVGDSKGDMVVAHAAGTYALGVSWGYQSKEELQAGKADRIIDVPADLLEVAGVR